MNEMQAMTPGFSGPQEPIARRASGLPRGLRSVDLALPPGLLDDARRLAAAAPAALARATGGAASPEERLVDRTTFGATPADHALAAELGYEGYLDRQLEPEAISDFGLEEALAEALPTLAMSAAELYERHRQQPFRPAFELIVASLYRALYSPRQLYERLVTLWSDHFNIHLLSAEQPFLKPTDDREVVRRHAMGKFPELLAASAHSPAMLVYLTNDSNVKDHPNENYSRELMELHTLGADNGYDQEDVREVARAFTGWTVRGPRAGGEFGTFHFEPRAHDDREKIVLGRTIPAGGGIEDGERVIEILGKSSRTAEFVARKLLVAFWGYAPRKRDVRKVADAYLDTGGDIRAMLRRILARKRMSKATPKLKRPFHLAASAVRGLLAEVRDPRYLFERLFVAGHLPFNWPPPNGYPDSEAYWSGFVLARWNFATTFLGTAGRTGIEVDLPFIDPSLPVGKIVDGIDEQLFRGSLPAVTRGELTALLESKKLDRKLILDAVGAAVASPEFQTY